MSDATTSTSIEFRGDALLFWMPGGRWAASVPMAKADATHAGLHLTQCAIGTRGDDESLDLAAVTFAGRTMTASVPDWQEHKTVEVRFELSVAECREVGHALLRMGRS